MKATDKGKKTSIGLKEIIELSDKNKTIGCRHIEYQTFENGLCGREVLKNLSKIQIGAYSD